MDLKDIVESIIMKLRNDALNLKKLTSMQGQQYSIPIILGRMPHVFILRYKCRRCYNDS